MIIKKKEKEIDQYNIKSQCVLMKKTVLHFDIIIHGVFSPTRSSRRITLTLHNSVIITVY